MDRSNSQFDKMSDKANEVGKSIVLGLGLGVGALAGGLLVKGFNDALDKEAGQAKLGIQLGLTPEQAEVAGRLSGEVYRDAFGESLAETNDAVASVTKNIGGLNVLSEKDFKDITKGVLTLADVFDQDLNKTTAAAGTILKNGLAPNAKAALDLLTAGFQGGANKADDLLDTFIEYSTQFRELGITGPQALGLLQQGLQGGARDADTVADSLKEFAIRAQDGSATTATAFAAIGLDAQTMAQTIAGGGEPAAQALQLTFDKLAAIEDPALRAQVATGLFGTKAEDLQNALSVMDLTTAETQVGNIEGKMTDATTATETNRSKIEEWRRVMDDNVANYIGESVIPKLEELGTAWSNGTGFVGDFRNGLAELGVGFGVLKNDYIDPIVGSLQTVYDKLTDLTDTEGYKFVTQNTGGVAGAAGGFDPRNFVSKFGGVFGAIASMGMDDGGVVPGPVGSPQTILAHGGETFIPTHKPGFSMAGGGATVIVQVQGSVTTERELVQVVRSGLLQADRVGRGSL